MAIQTTRSATPLGSGEPVLWVSVIVSLAVNAAMPQLSWQLNFPDWLEVANGGIALGECLLVLTLAGLMSRTWLSAYLTTLVISWLLIAAWVLSELSSQIGLNEFDMYAPLLCVPLLLLIASAGPCGLRQFWGLRLARESQSPWSRMPLGIGDVFVVMALAGALLVFARAPLLSGYVSRQEYWLGFGAMNLAGLGMGLLLAAPAVWCVFAAKSRLRMFLGLLGLSLFPIVLVAVIAPFVVQPDQVADETLRAIKDFIPLSGAAATYFCGVMFALYARGYRLLRAPYGETTEPPATRSRWIVAAIVVAAAIANFFISPIEDDHQRGMQFEVWLGDVGGDLDYTPSGNFSVILAHTAASDEDLEDLLTSRLRDAELLDLSATKITDAGLAHVGRLQALKELSLDSTEVSDRGLQHLRGLNLKTLSLMETNVTGVAFEHAPSWKTLRELNFGGAAVTDEGCTGIGRLAALTELELSGTSISDTGLRHVANLKNLQRLKLSRTQVHGEAFASFGKMPQLISVDFSSSSVGDGVANLFSNSPSLRHVGLQYSAITDLGLETLCANPNLTWLNLTGTEVTDQGLAALAELPSLQTLFLTDTKVTGSGFAQLVAPELASLSLQRTALTDDSVAELARLPKLRELVVSNTSIGDDALRHLSGMTLDRLSILDTRITAQGLLDAGLKVETIDVEANRFTAAEKSAIEKSIGRLEEVLIPLGPNVGP